MKIETRGPVAFLGFINLLFMLLLILSGSISGVLSTVIYIIAFLLPIILGFKSSADRNKDGDFLSFGGIKKAAPFVAPTILIVMGLSFLTSVIITAATGKTNDIDLGKSLILAILTHALAPAILEEALFRFIPLRVMKKERMIEIVLWSSVFFSLIHHSLFSMPYAFFAGAMFMIIDIYTGSIWPSVIIHFLNNALSVLFAFYGESTVFVGVALAVIIALTAVSIIYVVIKRESYREFMTKLFAGKLELKPTGEVWLLSASMIAIAIMELFV